MRLIKLLVLFLAISSTSALVLASRLSARPVITADAVQPAMNFAFVGLRGAIPAHPKVEEGYLSFRLRDESGEVRVVAYRQVASALQRARRIPAPGDRVYVEGTLRVREDDAMLILAAPELLRIERSSPRETFLAELPRAALGEHVRVRGQVRRVRDVAGLRIFTLRDGDVAADVVFPLRPAPWGEPPLVRLGEWIEVSGGVGEYRDAKQLLARNADDVKVVAPPRKALSGLDDITREQVGRWVSVRAQVAELRPFSAGMRIMLEDDARHTLDVVVFDDLWVQLPFSQTLLIGDTLWAQGEVVVYRGRLELLPELPADLGHEPS
ncbi:MAG: OB-fold nucleic acid binding domain-containing protein [Thermoflexales bacterium]|nr:OB-fold nucleic acid binding domain-containing protein [Thermoflexales bacterium]